MSVNLHSENYLKKKKKKEIYRVKKYTVDRVNHTHSGFNIK